MEQQDFDSLLGTVTALGMTLAAVIQTLGPLQAATAAASLALERETERLSAGTGNSRGTNARDATVDAYLGLLGAAARRRG